MPTLLIVDDDARAAEALALMLRREGHEVETAADAGKALEHLRRTEPDLVLLDLWMPRVDGMHLLEALKDDPRFEGVRVAVLTGRDEPGTADLARRLGACDFIEKGADWPVLYARICANLEPAGEAAPPAAVAQQGSGLSTSCSLATVAPK
jgi:DNA-binding response OmpR family regulator